MQNHYDHTMIEMMTNCEQEKYIEEQRVDTEGTELGFLAELHIKEYGKDYVE